MQAFCFLNLEQRGEFRYGKEFRGPVFLWPWDWMTVHKKRVENGAYAKPCGIPIISGQTEEKEPVTKTEKTNMRVKG